MTIPRTLTPAVLSGFHDIVGALGIKTVATLRLVTIPAVVKYASFSFETHRQICDAMAEIGRRGLASECYGFDPFLQNSRRDPAWSMLGRIKDLLDKDGALSPGQLGLNEAGS